MSIENTSRCGKFKLSIKDIIIKNPRIHCCLNRFPKIINIKTYSIDGSVQKLVPETISKN